MSKPVVHVKRNSLGEHVLTFAYDQRVVNAIKAKVNKRERSYDPRTKEWTILTARALSEFVWGTKHWIEFDQPRARSVGH